MSFDGYYDRQGRQITFEQWAEYRGEGQDGYKRVAATTVGESWISTVWVGIDMGYREGSPVIFETMAFGGPHDEDCERYSTEAEALAGHARWVALAESELETRLR